MFQSIPLSEKALRQKVAIYVRVSTQWQIDKDSLQVQKRELAAYAEMVLGIKDFVIFEDPGYSAKNTDRPEYQHMMSRLRAGEFSHLLVWKIDRISRNLLDFAQMYDELKQLGVVFVSKNEQFDTSSAIGEAMLKIILVFAELERKMTSERVTAVMLSRANNGQWNGGRIPYGYDHQKKSQLFTPNPVEAKIVCDIYNKYEQSQSIIYVVKYLNDLGLRTKQGNAWSPVAVHKILTNPFYIGIYRYNVHNDGKGIQTRDEKEWVIVENHHEPIISKIQFDRVQISLQRNKKGGNQRGESHISKNVHLFAGLLKCYECDGNMSATLDRVRANGLRPSIYACSRRRKGQNKCNNKYISDITLGPFVFNYVANIIRAKQTIGKRASAETLERKLLRGPVFANVDHIDPESLSTLYELLVNGATGLEYKPPISMEGEASAPPSQREHLEEQLRKKRIALNRLKTLYLYGDEETPEKDFIVERKRITDDIETLEKSLASIPCSSEDDLVQAADFVEKASYFIMVEKLLDDRYIDYETYIRAIDPLVPKNFLNSIISCIYVQDGQIVKIQFKNGMEHKFYYKKQNNPEP